MSQGFEPRSTGGPLEKTLGAKVEAGNRLRGSSKVQVRDVRGLQEKWPDGGCTLKAELTGGAGAVTWSTKEGGESKRA